MDVLESVKVTLYIIGFVLSYVYMSALPDMKSNMKSPFMLVSLYLTWPLIVPLNMFIRKVIHRNAKIQAWLHKSK